MKNKDREKRSIYRDNSKICELKVLLRDSTIFTSFSNILETLSEAVHQNRFSKRHEAKAERGRRPKIDEPGGNENPDSLASDVHSKCGKARG